ncbi:MAG TPA: Clp protease N-terminal domain-containing protein, partial [Phytomonospora sp.]
MELSLFDEDARGIVAAAVEIARERGHKTTTSAHLLLALASDPGASSTELLGSVGVLADAIGSRLDRILPPETTVDDDPPLADELIRLLDIAPREAGRLTETRVLPEHVLLALHGSG